MPVGGKPLIAYSIEQARQTPSIGRILVSTDDAEIASVAQDYGAEVVWRPAMISGDEATSESALLHALDHLRDREAYEPGLVVFLQATSPLRRPDDIERAIQTLVQEDADSLFSAGPVHGFVWRLSGGALSSLSYDYRNRQRRQEAPEDLVENGSIYVFRPWVLRELGNRLGGKIAVYRMDPLDSFQVDEPGDLPLMEQLLMLRRPLGDDRCLAAVRLLVLDFDGVMTDNRVLVDQDGREAVWCNRGDGLGIARLKEAGVQVLVLSTEANRVVEARCRKLGVQWIQACADKLARLRDATARLAVTRDETAYVGNDINDLPPLQWVGVPIAVGDAEPAVRAVARLVTSRPGGWGAVREVCEWVLSAKQGTHSGLDARPESLDAGEGWDSHAARSG